MVSYRPNLLKTKMIKKLLNVNNIYRSQIAAKYGDIGSSPDLVCSVGYSDSGKVYLQVKFWNISFCNFF
jgi:hypothetical protein